MPRLALRRRRSASSTPTTIGAIALGLAVGATAGYLLGEFLVGAAAGVLGGNSGAGPAHGSVAELVHDALSALENDPRLRECELDIVPVSRSAIEVHGWVPDRRTRLQAQRRVAEAVHPAEVINRILVRGEDDLGFDVPDDSDVLSA